MAKNRKSQSAAVRFGPVFKVVLLCSLICGTAIGYVWQKGQVGRLGKLQKEREDSLKKMVQGNESLGKQVGYLKSAVKLDQRAKELGLGLVPAQPQQVVRLVESTSAPAKSGPRQFARRPATGLTP